MQTKKSLSLWSIILLPISALYFIVVAIRNLLYDCGLKQSHAFHLPIICVGNITAGGTGKTPVTEYILRLLANKGKVAMLSRGYKRTTSGFIVAKPTDSYKRVGDEPMQVKQKLPSVIVAVDSNRCRGVRKLLLQTPNLQAIILDDAFQHRKIKAGLSILLMDYNRMIFTDSLLPIGRLREPVVAKERAQVVIVTKCPHDIRPIDIRVVIKRLELRPYQTLFFASTHYGELVPAFESTPSFTAPKLPQKLPAVLLITGIAVNTPLVKYIKTIATEIEVMEFSDHHDFTKKEIKQMHTTFANMPQKDKIIITTEKDKVRLKEHNALTPEFRNALYYLPIEINILHNREQEFNNLIYDYVRTDTRISSISKK